MGREHYTVGDHWLDKRADGRSPFWQITWYDAAAKTTRCVSTRTASLDAAKDAIHAYVEDLRSKSLQTPDDALVLAVLKRFYQERVIPKVRNKSAFTSSFRVFTGFLMQDKASVGAVVSDLTPDLWERFIDWRAGPHSYNAPWEGKTLAHSSEGVSGEAIQRNLADVQTALNYATKRGRLPHRILVPKVDAEMRSPPRDVTLSMEKLGAIVGYALNDIEALRWVLAMIATGARPDACLALDPARQYKQRSHRLLDMQPPDWPRTKKRNAVVPVIEPLHPWLVAWAEHPHKPAKSRKRWWRNMRAALDLPVNIVPKVIRHTIATELRARGVPQSDVEGLLGHQGVNRITEVYSKYDPTRLSKAKQELAAIWREVWAEAFQWLSDHYRTTSNKGAILIKKRGGAAS